MIDGGPRALAGHAWLPDRRRLSHYLVLALVVDTVFVVVYGGCNWLTARRDDRLRMFAEWELSIPFVSWMIVPYCSIAAALVAPLFVLDESELRRLAARMVVATLLGGAVFLALPGESGFVRPVRVEGFAPAFRLLYALDLPYNLVPSLHVAFCALIAGALAERARPWVARLLGAWVGVVCLAVLFVHQHHVADVLGGLIVASACRRFIGSSRRELS